MDLMAERRSVHTNFHHCSASDDTVVFYPPLHLGKPLSLTSIAHLHPHVLAVE